MKASMRKKGKKGTKDKKDRTSEDESANGEERDTGAG